MTHAVLSHEAPHACWHCQHYGGMDANGITGYCARPGAAPVVAQPEHGCAYWAREPGADDDDPADPLDQ